MGYKSFDRVSGVFGMKLGYNRLYLVNLSYAGYISGYYGLK